VEVTQNMPKVLATVLLMCCIGLSQQEDRVPDRGGNVTTTQASDALANHGPAELVLDLGGEVTIQLVRIPPGEFMMGSPDSEAKRSPCEGPKHRVRIRHAFYMGKYEVTQGQWQKVMGKSLMQEPSECVRSAVLQEFRGDDRPMAVVSWAESKAFCQRVSSMTGHRIRLPSEAEWEYACRAGTTTPFHYGGSLTSEQANFDGILPYGEGKYRATTTPVGSFQPNGFGLYDMHGNVAEWCEDIWHNSYVGAPTDGSPWRGGWLSSLFPFRVTRGGHWQCRAYECRSASRAREKKGILIETVGFRIVMEEKTEGK
jgi:formylglycine-generating enzyme required for sulfatase activity